MLVIGRSFYEQMVVVEDETMTGDDDPDNAAGTKTTGTKGAGITKGLLTGDGVTEKEQFE